jgi:hypothetical protein
MRIDSVSGLARDCRVTRAFRPSATILLACCALALPGTLPVAAVQDAKTPSVVPAPSADKAMVCIYRVTRITGSASHDFLYINGAFLATLLSGEYAFMEVSPGTVVVSGLPKMYYGGALYSSAAALNDLTKKENERIRIDVEAGKTYYLKWTAGPMASGIKVTLEEPSTGAKEMSKLHLSAKPPEGQDKK